jgi:hypothetical protein
MLGRERASPYQDCKVVLKGSSERSRVDRLVGRAAHGCGVRSRAARRLRRFLPIIHRLRAKIFLRPSTTPSYRLREISAWSLAGCLRAQMFASVRMLTHGGSVRTVQRGRVNFRAASSSPAARPRPSVAGSGAVVASNSGTLYDAVPPVLLKVTDVNGVVETIPANTRSECPRLRSRCWRFPPRL